MLPHNVNPVQWTQALGYARVSCARVFRDGGTPADALAAFSLLTGDAAAHDWAGTVETIAMALCSRPAALAA